MYYDSNKADFIKYPVSHILIMPKPDSAIGINEADSIALVKINLILDSLKSGKVKFEDLAIHNSMCPSGKNGGDLGAGSLKNWAPGFGKAVLKLKSGEVSGVVKTKFGYHIIFVEDTKKASIATLKKYESKIASELKIGRAKFNGRILKS